MNLDRLSKIRIKMNQLSFDHLIVTSTDAIFYLLGEEIHPGERLLALLISQDETKLFVSALFPIDNPQYPVYYFKDEEDIIKILAKEIKPQTIIGIDKFWPSQFLLKLMKELPNHQFEIGSEAVDAIRLLKDGEEIKRMRTASEINDRIMDEIIAYIYEEAPKGNLTEIQVQKKIKTLNEGYGIYELSFTPSVSFGKNGAEPHHDCDDTVLKKGMAVVIDMGGRKKGYCSDMTRSFYYGDATDKYKEVYELVLKANMAAIKAVKPGVKLSEIDYAARQVIENGGYGEFFTHRTGHGIGINVHEFPDVSMISESTCEPGMLFSIEPGIYLLGEFGVRIEDIVLVTEEGCEVLNSVRK
ncbi:aminopeptidase P family protein [Fusibacter bizertensis]|uniref:Aminopeptidase P family protein n=1 Tax=Fusibacter bizertensis TaxID=1488331 RepID=A0ABT6ND26_9FIRM|nr:aminopeptidase P family protein [Fusibacter bizertensis]MDH8678337.1 aminopeptidase P family protein [Fusibacter bizertensis]